MSPIEADGRERVPGNNPAFYSGPPSKDQLFFIQELDILPHAPKT